MAISAEFGSSALLMDHLSLVAASCGGLDCPLRQQLIQALTWKEAVYSYKMCVWLSVSAAGAVQEGSSYIAGCMRMLLHVVHSLHEVSLVDARES